MCVLVGVAVALACAAPAAAERPAAAAAINIRAAHQARLLVAQADWDYSGTVTSADRAFARPGNVTRADTLLRAARRAGIGGSNGLDDVEVRRFVLTLAGGDTLLDYTEQFALLRALRREQGTAELQLPARPPQATLSTARGVRMLRYRGDTSGDGLITFHDDPAGEGAPSFAAGLRIYASRNGIGDGKRLGNRELTAIVRRFTGADGLLSLLERKRLEATIRPR